MFSCNEQHWPMVMHEFAGLQTLAEHEQSLRIWNTHFARGEAFVIIRLFRDEESLVHPEGAAKLTKAWLRDGAAETIKTSVAAMINIVPESAYERMKHMSVETAFGVPGGVFKSIEEACEWFNTTLGSVKNLSLDSSCMALGSQASGNELAATTK